MRTEKYVDIESPFTGGRVKEISDCERKEFRKEWYDVHVRYYVCEDTGEQFTSGEQDELWTNELYGQYRVRHGIPFPDEIKKIRQDYGLNYGQMSKILGFGINQYAQYENGQVPSESNGKIILAIKDNPSLMLKMLDGAKESFPPKEYEKIRESILLSQTRVKQDDFSVILFYGNTKRSILNGFGEKNVAKLKEMVGYIICALQEVGPTKLNKLMFYSDFYNYKLYGRSISGLEYRAIQYGPVPLHYATIYDNIEGITKRIFISHNISSSTLSCRPVTPAELEANEISTINFVLEKLGSLSVAEIVDLSHREEGWIKYSANHEIIPYSGAFGLGLA